MVDDEAYLMGADDADPAYEEPVRRRARMKPHRGSTILTLGIVGVLCCFITGIIAWVMASEDLKMMDAGVMDPSGRGSTQAGKILGIISVVLAGIGLLVTGMRR